VGQKLQIRPGEVNVGLSHAGLNGEELKVGRKQAICGSSNRWGKEEFAIIEMMTERMMP